MKKMLFYKIFQITIYQGGPKCKRIWYELALKLIPFLLGRRTTKTKFRYLGAQEVLPKTPSFSTKYRKDFQNLQRKIISTCIFNLCPQNSFFRQNWHQKLQSLGPDTSLDTNINGLDQLCRLWQLWPYHHNGHIRDKAIVAIAYQGY